MTNILLKYIVIDAVIFLSKATECKRTEMWYFLWTCSMYEMIVDV